jgi:PAS domain S-box-containing protein
MQIFQNISIKRKLIFVILLTGGIALLLTSAALFKYEMSRFQQNLIDRLATQAEIIGSNSTAALVFRDQKAAEEILSALKAAPNITNAVMYSGDGSVFAQYRRYDVKKDYIPDIHEKDAYHFKSNHVDISHRIVLAGKEIGLLYIRSDLKDFYSRLKWYAGTILIIMVISLFLSLMLSSRLQQAITKPILDLLNVMKTISQDKNYSLRASVQGRDEIGSLTGGFNDMLSQIQERDSELDLHRKHLEELVLKRTDELKSINKQLQYELGIRQLAEEALVIEKEQLSVTLRSIGDGVITTDINGNIVLMNKVAEDMTGWSLEKAAGRPLSDIFHIINEKNRERCENPVTKVIESGLIVDLEKSTLIISQNGQERVIADSCAPIRDKDSKIIGVVLVFQDITEKQKLEEELFRSQKLESVGVLAGGIAHDFNNLLTAILGNISLAKIYLSPQNKIFNMLSDAETASLRARDLTQQLLTFSKGGAPVKKPSSIVGLIKDSASFILSGSKVHCEFDMPEDLWPVEIDEGQMSQVINNLIINADQAMPQGGIIQVTCKNVMVTREDKLPVKEGKYIKVSITDQGMGISEIHFGKIFDPYFTTKEKGRGLGLATVYSIIKNHDGHISVESRLGVGTTFHIYLPASEARIPVQKIEDKKPLAGKGRILIMDDEEVVRNVAGLMLNNLGYETGFAKDGNEAIELYNKARESGQPFDAVIMDLTIPGGMGGVEAIKILTDMDPEIKAIVSSGYSNDPVMANFREYGFSGAVSKPYKVKELLDTLNDIITRTDG